MCDGRSCADTCGQDEFRRYEETLRSDQVLYPAQTSMADLSYGIIVNRPAQQWEIVAVRGCRPRHVAFVSTAFCVDRVLEIVAKISLANDYPRA